MTVTTNHAPDYIKILLEKTRDNRSLALIIIKKLFEELPEQIDAIKDALASQQYILAQQITHKLHGSACFCGLTDIQKSACALENSLLDHDYEATRRHFLILQQYICAFTCHQAAILADLADNSG